MKLKIAALAAYLLMIATNALANILPINGVTTGEVSDSYVNLFAPAGITFAIWGVIYLLLGMYTVFQLGFNKINKETAEKVNHWFIFSSVVNSSWIFAWHYQLIWLSVVLMGALLVSLIKIAEIYNQRTLSFWEKLYIKIPFGVYFGWITIATIANITTFLVSLGWDGFGIRESLWTVIVLLVGVMIATWRTIKDTNIAYGLVPVWAYFGIWLKHTSDWGFGGGYPEVISTAAAGIAVLVIVNGYLLGRKKAL